MLINKQLAILTAIFFAAFALPTKTDAQVLASNPIADSLGQGHFNRTSFGADVDPGSLEYDMRVFEPLDVSEYSGGLKAHSGFSASYDRSYLSFSRADAFGGASSASTPKGAPYQWGNHFVLGYTNQNGNGWNVDYTKSSGSVFTGTPNAGNPMLTTSSIHSVALNRLYRTDLSRGGYIQPFAGIRFMNVNDQTNATGALTRTDPGPDGLPGGGDDVVQTITGRLMQEGANNAVGGQLGMTYFQSHGRWTIATEMGLSGLYNSQTSTASTSGAFPAGPTLPATTGGQTFGSENSFLPVAQLGVNTTYGLTRDVSLRLGAQWMYMWDGLNRADPTPFAANPNVGSTGGVPTVSQDATLVGFTFGLEWRR